MLTKDGKEKNKKTGIMTMNLKEKGFTLLEVIIAVLVLGIGILGLIQMQVAAMNGNLSASKMTTAVNLAQDEIEQLKRLALTDAALTDNNAGNNANLTSTPNAASFEHSDANNPIDESGGTTGLRRYLRFWNVADNTPTQGAKTVVVFVYWGTVNNATGLTQHRVMVPTIIGG
jgi:type IV pilus modification protein PilV